MCSAVPVTQQFAKNSTSNVHEKMTYIHGMVLIMMIVSESDKLKKFVTKLKNQSQL